MILTWATLSIPTSSIDKEQLQPSTHRLVLAILRLNLAPHDVVEPPVATRIFNLIKVGRARTLDTPTLNPRADLMRVQDVCID